RPAPPHRARPRDAEPGAAVAARRAAECPRCRGAAGLPHRPAATSCPRRPGHRCDPCRSRRARCTHLRALGVTGVLALLSRDLRLVWRRPGDVAVVLAFFVVATVLFPLGIGPQANILARIAAGVLWCTALFASMLSLDRLFAADYEDGSLDLLLLAPWPLELAALAKCAAHWIVTGLPLAVLAPLLGVTFGLPPDALIALAATLLVGTPTLSLIGGLAAALTLGARRGGALLALLALPLCVPTLIFGAAAIETLMTGEDLLAHIAILAALALVALATTPWAMAAALRQAGEKTKTPQGTTPGRNSRPAFPRQPGALPPLQPARAAGAHARHRARLRGRPLFCAAAVAARLPA